MVKTILAVVGMSALSGSALALTLPKNDELARDAAVQWLELIDAHRYEEAASQGAQEVRSFEQWLNHFKTQRAALGRISKRQFVELKRAANISGVPDVRRYCILRFKSSFEHPPSRSSGVASRYAAIEVITIAKIGCCWEVFEYKIE